MSSSTIDLIYSSSANTSQPIRAMLGSSTSITNQYYLGTNNLQAVAVASSANPVCANTPFTLSLTNILGVSSVYWIDAHTASSDASTGFALQVPNGISGPTTFQVSISGGCSPYNYTVTRSITVTPLTDNLSQVAGERDVVVGANQGAVTLTNYKGAIQYWQSSPDNGTSWTTLNQTTEDLPYTNLTVSTLYRAVTNLCGTTFTSASCPIRVHAATADLSWTETKTFALDGTALTSDSRTYVDGFAKPLQSQAKSLSTGKILAAQPLYGKYDQAVGSTLAAPITPTEFAYQPAFLAPASATSASYDYTRFDDVNTVNAPETVSAASPNSLGWYYSRNNNAEPYTAVTSYPYSRTDAMPDGSTGVSRAVGPAPGLQLGSTHETVQGSFRVGTELDQYLALRNQYITTTTAATSSVVNCPSADRLLAWLPFNDPIGATVAHDASGNLRDGQLRGGTWFPGGGGSLGLAGADNVRVPLTLSSPTEFTVSFWVNPTNLANYNEYVGALNANNPSDAWGAFGFHTTTDGTICVGINATGKQTDRIVTAPGVMVANEWQHYVFTYSAAGTGTFYRNGILIQTLAGMPRPAPWAGFVVGGSAIKAECPFQGSINDLRIYGREISGVEALGLYQCHLPAVPAAHDLSQGLMTWLPFDDQGGSMAKDASGHSLAGQVTGGAWTAGVTSDKGALALTSTQDVQIPLAGTPTAFTVTFWVNPPQVSDYSTCLAVATPQQVYGVWGAFCFHTTATGAVAAGVNALGANDRIVTAPGVMEVNTWQHYVFTYSSGTGRLYKNGQLLSLVDNMPAPGAWTRFVVGGNSLNGLPFNASIADLRVYFRAISSQEAQDIYLKNSLRKNFVQRLSTDEDGNTSMVFQDKEGHTVMNARPATKAVVAGQPDAWMTTTSTVEVGWPYSVQLPANTTLGASIAAAFAYTADIMVLDDQGRWLVTGSADDIAANPSMSGNVGNFKFFSTAAFTITAASTAGGAASAYTSQQREAYPFYNFYLVGDGVATIADKSGTPASVYTLVNTVTGQPVTFGAGTTLPPGCYQLRIEKGAVNLTYTNRYKDLSYSFYNQKGQVIETIAPKGVQQLLQSIAAGGTNAAPAYATTYEYDQQGRQTALNETDGGRTEFVYRADGKLRFSQNAKQRANGYFSYLNYDTIGRVLEAGENQGGSALFATCKASPAILEYVPAYDAYDDGGMGCQNRKDVVRSYYDKPTSFSLPSGYSLDGYTRNFLSGRVAATQRASLFIPCAVFAETSRTIYSYDEQGRTQWQVQQVMNSGQPARTIDYTYDAAGNTATVCYQKNTPAERLTHYYTYDADNRLSLVQTDRLDPASSVLAARTEQARYTYYLHGPLKRVVYGGNLQGVDYTYTAAGQLKSINDGDIQQDPGQDGLSGSAVQYPDFFGTSLNYYKNDYASAAVPSLSTTMVSTGGQDFVEHYNGLVSGIAWQTPGSPLNAYGYNYDYKGQLTKANYGVLSSAAGRQYSFVPDPVRYQEGNLDYDANGNIGHLQRTDGVGLATLAGAYNYAAGSNQLNQVLNAGSPAVSYTYDAIGQVTAQQESDPTKSKYLEYDASGKVTAIFDRNQNPVAKYTYDEFGKRMLQQVYPNPLDQTSYTTTTFVRDAAGHELASYVAVTTANSTAPAFLYEQPIYGATRLGIYRQARDQTPAEQLYELNDQLGNTRVVFRRPTTATYTLSVGSAGSAQASQEQQNFPGPTPATYDNVRSANYNHPLTTPGYSVRLSGSGIGVGPTKTIAAQRGDKFHLTVYGLYNNSGTGANLTAPTSTTSKLAPSLTGIYLATGPRPALPTESTQPASRGVQQVLSQISLGISIPLLTKAKQPSSTQTASLTAGTLGNTGNGPPPAAALQYTIYRASDHTPVGGSNGSGQVYLQSNSAVDWQLLALDFTITQDYPVTVEVATMNTSGSVAAYFDDLTVQYTPGPVIEENHYYAYGQRNEGLSWRRIDERLYGRGYQGQNTTQDAESGYTAFDARVYDSRLGRWASPDPLRQFDSPYSSMGNNPNSYIDSDGKWVILATMAIGATLNAGSTALDIYLSGGKFDAKAGKRIFASAIGGAIAGSGFGGLPVAVGLGMAGNILDQAIDKDFTTDMSKYKRTDIYIAGLAGLVGGRAAERLGKLVYSPVVNQSVKRFLEKNLEQSVGAVLGYSATKFFNFGMPSPLQQGYPKGSLQMGQPRGMVEVGNLNVTQAGDGITSYDLPQMSEQQ